MKLIIRVCSGVIGVMLSSAAFAGYMVSTDYTHFSLGNENYIKEFYPYYDDIVSTEIDVTTTAGSSRNRSIAKSDLSDASVRLYVESSGNSPSDGLASAGGTMEDFITFDLGGESSMYIPFSIKVDGNYIGTDWFGQGYFGVNFGGASVGTGGATNPLSIFGSTFSGQAFVTHKTPSLFRMHYRLTIAPLGPGFSNEVFDSLNSAVFTWDLPEGVTYSSDSGVFLTGNGSGNNSSASVPEPGILSMLAMGLVGLGVHARRKFKGRLKGRTSDHSLPLPLPLPALPG